MEFEGRSRIDNELGMAPLIDVVFLLLLFFMLTSTFADPRAIDLSLPTSASATARPDAPIAVAIDEQGEVFLNGASIALDALQAEVATLLDPNPDETVTLGADAEVRVQRLVDVMDRVRAAGALNLAFETARGAKPDRGPVQP